MRNKTVHLSAAASRKYLILRTVLNLKRVLALAICVAGMPSLIYAQNLDVPYVSTPTQVVEGMLDMANVGPGDYVIDLGSGDGRIVIEAARRGAVGHGVDLNPVRVKEAEENAIKSEVSDRVIFLEENIFETDFSQASVVTMYLLSSVNRQLRPQLFEQLKPGTRVVSHAFDMDTWKPDQHIRIDNRNIYFWVIPAVIEGSWQWEMDGVTYAMSATQEFQEVTAKLTAGGNELQIKKIDLKGDRINVQAESGRNDSSFIFSGRIEENQITGSVQIRNQNGNEIKSWNASRDL